MSDPTEIPPFAPTAPDEEEAEEAESLVSPTDGSDSWGVSQNWEGLHRLKRAHMIVTWLFGFAAFASAVVWGLGGKDATTPFTTYSWYILAAPLLGILIFGLALWAWANNMNPNSRGFYTVMAIIYAVILGGLFIFNLVAMFSLCVAGPPFKLWCTNGLNNTITVYFTAFFWLVIIQLVFLIVDLVLFSYITKRVKFLTNPISGVTHEQMVRELYSSHGPRYLSSVGSSLEVVWSKLKKDRAGKNA